MSSVLHSVDSMFAQGTCSIADGYSLWRGLSGQTILVVSGAAHKVYPHSHMQLCVCRVEEWGPAANLTTVSTSAGWSTLWLHQCTPTGHACLWKQWPLVGLPWPVNNDTTIRSHPSTEHTTSTTLTSDDHSMAIVTVSLRMRIGMLTRYYWLLMSPTHPPTHAERYTACLPHVCL